MTWFTGTVTFILVWWTALFAVLPFGTRPNPEGDPEAGGWRGTPEQPRLLRKLVATTLVSVVIWLGLYLVAESGWVSFREGWLAMPDR